MFDRVPRLKSRIVEFRNTGRYGPCSLHIRRSEVLNADAGGSQVPGETEDLHWARLMRWRAVVVGMAADIAATMALWSLYANAFLAEKIEKYGGLDRIPEESLSQEELAVLGLIGVAGTVFGGYVAGRIAERQETRHGAAAAAAALVLGLGLELALQGALRFHWSEIPLLILMIPAGAFGGYLAGRLR